MVYILTALTNAANDEVEYKFGFRPEGTVAAALVGCVTGIICGAFSGCYETGLSMNGYLPEKGVNQVPGVVNWIYFVRYVVPIIEYVVLIILLKFMDLEKKTEEGKTACLEEEKGGRRFALKELPMTVGKLKGKVSIELTDSSVSRIHAKLLTLDGKICVLDLNSRNGTLVNGRKLSPNESAALQEGDLVVVTAGVVSYSKRHEPASDTNIMRVVTVD